MPGKGDFRTRLIDYLVVGACVVRPPSDVRLPVRRVDDDHVVHCERDLSSLGDVCAELVRDAEYGSSSRDYFDRHVHRRQLAQRYLDDITDAQAGAAPIPLPRSDRQAAAARAHAVGVRRRRYLAVQSVVLAFAVLLVALVLFEYRKPLATDRTTPRPSEVLRDLK